MKMIYFITFGKYRKFENSEILYIFGKTLVLPIICSKCDGKKKYLKQKNQLRYQKFFV